MFLHIYVSLIHRSNENLILNSNIVICVIYMANLDPEICFLRNNNTMFNNNYV